MTRTCYVIAEAGSCHDGSLAHARELIEIAASADANAVKFQWWSDSLALAKRRHDETLVTKYEPYRMPAEWLPELARTAQEYGMDFMCTVYMEQDIATVAPFVKNFKIASFDALDESFVRAHEPFKKPVIMSLGMLTQTDSITTIPFTKLLQCTSSYPCPPTEMNLGVIQGYNLDGFSDHTGDPMMGAWAFLAGADIIETHFRSYQTERDNPDYPHALSPTLLRAYIATIRQAEKAWGTGEKITQPSEAANRKYMA